MNERTATRCGVITCHNHEQIVFILDSFNDVTKGAINRFDRILLT